MYGFKKRRKRMRTFYSEYVQHCMKFYSRHPQPRFKSIADKLNWNACDDAMKHYDDTERDIILTVYRETDTIPDNIYAVSKARNVTQDYVWSLIKHLESRVAKRRGLL